MRGRLDLRQIELGHLPDRLQDGAELLLEPRDLFLGEREAREPRDMEHLVSRYRHQINPSKSRNPFLESPSLTGEAGLRPARAAPTPALPPQEEGGQRGKPGFPR